MTGQLTWAVKQWVRRQKCGKKPHWRCIFTVPYTCWTCAHLRLVVWLQCATVWILLVRWHRFSTDVQNDVGSWKRTSSQPLKMTMASAQGWLLFVKRGGGHFSPMHSTSLSWQLGEFIVQCPPTQFRILIFGGTSISVSSRQLYPNPRWQIDGGHLPDLPDDIRLHNVGHFKVYCSQGRCHICQKKLYKCEKCNRRLHADRSKMCFVVYHTKWPILHCQRSFKGTCVFPDIEHDCIWNKFCSGFILYSLILNYMMIAHCLGHLAG